jgi:hypothetical protein
MSLLKSLQSANGVRMAIIAVALGVAAVVTTINLRGRTPSTTGWFYDIEQGELFTASIDQIPPTNAPSGENNGVKAIVMTCDGCGDDERFIAWVETYTDEAKAVLERYGPDADPTELADDPGMMVVAVGSFVADAGEKPLRWVRQDSPEGNSILRSAMTRCGGKTPMPCAP